MKKILFLASLAFAVSLDAQNARKPKLDVPAEWSRPFPAPPSTDPEAMRTWWRMFDDSTLTSLVAGALESNVDLREATARVSEARAAHGIARSALAPRGEIFDCRLPACARAFTARGGRAGIGR